MFRFLTIKKNMSDFLQSGIYSFNQNHTQLTLCNDLNEIYEISKTNMDQSKKKKIVSYVYHLIPKKVYKVENRKGYFYGTRLLIPNNDTGFKVFDDYSVLTFYNDIDYKNKMITNRNKMSLVFCVPEVLNVDSHYLIEKKIPTKNFEADHFIHYMFDAYMHYFQSNQIEVSQNSSEYKKKYKKIFKKFYRNFKEITNKQTVFQHGDIWNGNILFDHQYYLIDFEICANRFYLYDFFFYIYSYVFIYNNYTYLDNYFNGNYDMVLIKYCDSLNLKYNVTLKSLYFKEFILNFMEDRFQDYSIRIFYKESKKIMALFARYNI